MEEEKEILVKDEFENAEDLEIEYPQEEAEENEEE